ncbi:hypothetical protein G6O67_000424 [Ophiocordyceps sinensis]|uniref:Uncharacterized protein n=1 Tax=Ophiocordyceps sinensis TaxID=72228 RepID=A0A8H4PZ56_9HYPO|nr:hypothetical protein G6O67_000424 [Ophiocordyceps sinensis]
MGTHAPPLKRHAERHEEQSTRAETPMNDNVDPTTRPRRQSDTRPQGRHRHAQEGKAIPDLRDDTDTPKKAKRDVLRQHRAQAALGSANQSRSTGTARMNASKAPKSEELGAWSKKSCYLCGNARRMRDCGEANGPRRLSRNNSSSGSMRRAKTETRPVPSSLPR